MCKEKRWKEISKSQKNDQRRGLHYLALGGCRAVFHLFWHSHWCCKRRRDQMALIARANGGGGEKPADWRPDTKITFFFLPPPGGCAGPHQQQATTTHGRFNRVSRVVTFGRVRQLCVKTAIRFFCPIEAEQQAWNIFFFYDWRQGVKSCATVTILRSCLPLLWPSTE